MQNIDIYTTTYENEVLHQSASKAEFVEDTEVENQLVNVHPDVRYQTLRGFGGTFTEAAGYCLSKAGPAVLDEVLQGYFGADGLGYTQGRVHLDSCDASLSNYSALSAPTSPDDTELAGFSIARDEEYLLPMLQKAQEISGGLELMISPWSPPPFMKTNGEKNNGGKLKEEYYPLWARYICRFIKEYEQRGVRFAMISLQNEPKAVQTWDSCVYTAAEEREYLRQHLVPELRRQGLGHLEVMVWDHNKERALERAQTVMADDEMRKMVSGTAVHWYSGDHFEQLQMLKQLYPEKRIIFSEGCVEYSKFERDDYLSSARMYAHEIIGDLNAGADAFIHWSLVFDPKGGPNHVNNLCEGVVVCDWERQKATCTLPFYYIGHFSRHIKPGAVRLGHSRYTEKLDVTAFENPDGSRAVVVLNKTDGDVPFLLRQGDKVCPHTAQKDSILTMVYNKV